MRTLGELLADGFDESHAKRMLEGKTWGDRLMTHACENAETDRGGGARPCSCAMGCKCPDCGCGDPIKRRLPIYGERDVDRELRELRSTWRFGHWLHGLGQKTRSRLEHFEELIDAIDAQQSPFVISIDDVAFYFSTEDFEDFEERGDKLHALFDEASWRFLSEELRKRLRRPIRLGDIDHSCFGAIECMRDWPQETGVYYVQPGGADLVKIGHGKNIDQRVRTGSAFASGSLSLLAWEPGPASLERQRHKQFNELRLSVARGARQGREFFRLESPLLEHILGLRRLRALGLFPHAKASPS